MNLQAMIRTLDGKETEASFSVTPLSRAQAFRVGLKRLAVYWGIALLWLPVPFFHFFMPVIFLLIGIIALIHALSTISKRIEESHFKCLHCAADIALKPRYFKPSFKEHCTSCRHELRIALP